MRESSDLWRLEKVHQHLHLVSIHDLEREFSKRKFQCIIHCATNYGGKEAETSSVFNDNLVWPLELIGLGSRFGLELFINTDTFYSKNGEIYEHLPNYTLSKKFLDQVLRVHRMKTLSLRLEHVYGPMDASGKFVGSMISKLREGVPEIELTDGQQKRDFVYVEDVAEAYIKVLSQSSSLGNYEEIEVGTGKSSSIRQLVESIKALLRNEHTRLTWGALPRRQNEFEESRADINKLAALGWEAKTSLKEGLQKTINWSYV